MESVMITHKNLKDDLMPEELLFFSLNACRNK